MVLLKTCPAWGVLVLLVAAALAVPASAAEALRVGQTDTRAPGPPLRRFAVTVLVQGEDLAALRKRAERLRAELARSDRLAEVHAEPRVTVPELRITPDLKKMAELKVPAADLAATLQIYLGEGVSRVGEAVRVVPGRNGPVDVEGIKALKLRSADGRMVPLSAVARIEHVQPPALFRYEGRRGILLTADLAPGVRPEDARAAVREAIRRLLADEKPGPDERILLGGADLVTPEELIPRK